MLRGFELDVSVSDGLLVSTWMELTITALTAPDEDSQRRFHNLLAPIIDLECVTDVATQVNRMSVPHDFSTVGPGRMSISCRMEVDRRFEKPMGSSSSKSYDCCFLNRVKQLPVG